MQPPKRVLYFGEDASEFIAALADAPTSPEGLPLVRDVPLEWVVARTPAQALERLAHDYVNLLLVDLRGGTERGDGQGRQALRLLDHLDAPADVEARYGFHRILALVSGPDPEAVDDLTADLGRRGVGRVIRDRSGSPAERRAFATEIADRAIAMILDRPRGRTAICCSGGGITGIFFELGALKCLDDCLVGGALHDFDMYFGISAGAVVNGAMAVGYSPGELMAGIAGVPGGRIPHLDLSLLRLSHLNYADMVRRLGIAAKQGLGELFGALSRRSRRASLDEIFLDYTALIGTPFRSDRFGKLLRTMLNGPGACDDFRTLTRELYVGASDQDRREHVLFGSEGHDDVPIHKAIQASLSVNPAFSAVRIGDRFYEDGQVTRTSNFAEAVHRGADLILVIDPFVPYVSKEPGHADARGMLYNIDQNVRSISFTRFLGIRDTLLRRHPHVSSYTFLPANRVRGLLSSNPMDHRPYMEIWRGAYLGTLSRIHRLAHRMRGDLAAHGVVLDTARADAVAEQLEATASPTFADFFPDRRVAIRRPPLCREVRQV